MTNAARPRPKIRVLNILTAVLAIVAGAALAWGGWTLQRAAGLAVAAAEARIAAGAALQATLAAERDRLESQRALPAVRDALRAGDADGARKALAGDWVGIEAVEIHPVDLAPAWAEAERFGYGKLGVLVSALDGGAVQLAVVQDTGRPWLVLAAPIAGEGGVIALAYVRRPLDALRAQVDAAAPEGAYAALRQGSRSLLEAGDRSLADAAERGALAIDGSRLRLVGASPYADPGLFGMNGLAELVAGLLVVLGGFALVLVPHEKAGAFAKRLGERRGKSPAEAEPTLAELQAQAQAAPPKPVAAVVEARPPPPELLVERSIFRAYDIRGVVGSTLSADVARLIGRAIGALMKEKGLRGIAVGRDGRLSSPDMARALIDGLRMSGIDVTDVGMVPTPVAYFAAHELRLGSAIAVTGSHNPPDYNGFKIVVDGETLSGSAISDLYVRIAEGRMPVAERRGDLDTVDIGQAYIDRIAGDIQIERRLRVVVDAGSGVAGDLGPRLLEAIGADVETLYCDIDGSFPFHHPDPSDPHNLEDLVQAVQRAGADLGLAFDGDGDRLGVVTKHGEMIYPDRLLMLFAADVLERNPGAAIIYDVKCSGHLAGFVLRHGGSPLMWKTGHSLIKAKMKETAAELAGEMSGHFFFKERWYGFDDGLYAAARLLEILATRAEEPEEVFAELPKAVSTPELKIAMQEGEPHAFIEAFVASARFEGARVSTIDGVRADWPDGWGLVRASNTTPILVLRFEADDEAALDRVKDAFRERLLAQRADLVLPF
ncbi:MAG TPA: phosphomannomutase [Xanthomonadaceae bacterium]|jgi:phosphomannomutase/phosphoglucomutase|nr:phosphomannomutase [Xanthomonadaceae bacterium]